MASAPAGPLRVYVRNLPFQITKAYLHQCLSSLRLNIQGVHIARQGLNMQHCMYCSAFLTVPSEDELRWAVHILNGRLHPDMSPVPLVAERAIPRMSDLRGAAAAAAAAKTDGPPAAPSPFDAEEMGVAAEMGLVVEPSVENGNGVAHEQVEDTLQDQAAAENLAEVVDENPADVAAASAEKSPPSRKAKQTSQKKRGRRSRHRRSRSRRKGKGRRRRSSSSS